MRIALVTEFYYPHLGGVTEHVHNLARQFTRLGHHVTILTSNMAGQETDATPEPQGSARLLAPSEADPSLVNRNASWSGTAGAKQHRRTTTGARLETRSDLGSMPGRGRAAAQLQVARVQPVQSHAALEVAAELDPCPPPLVRRIGKSWIVFSNGSFSRFTTANGLEKQVEKVLREDRIDVVHVQMALVPGLGLSAPEAARRLGIPVVATFHSWFPGHPLYAMFRRPLQQRLDRIDAKIAVSEPVVSAMSRYFEADWEIIPNGVNVGYFHPNGRRPTDALKRGPRLLFLGRLDPRNGLDTVLAAMPRILERFPKTELTVAGDGPLRPYYEKRARHLGESVRFVGRVYDERPQIYSAADLYVCPTTKASFGITLLESMASGTPVVASDIIGFRELVDGGSEAVLVPVDDPAAWAAMAIRLLDDPERRAAMGRAGLAKAMAFSWPGVAHRVLQVYERVTR